MHKSNHERNMTLYILNVNINENQSLDPSNPFSDTVFPTYTSKIITLAKNHLAKTIVLTISFNATSLSTYNFSTLYTTVPHNLLKKNLLI